MVRYGNGTTWRYRQDSGTGICNGGYMYYWGPMQITECQVFHPSIATAPAVMPGGGPLIDMAKIPFANPGSPNILVQPSPHVYPLASDGVGAVRTVCNFTHMAADDPLVAPGVPGGSHLHVFFGNTGTNAYSTAASIANTGASSCRGGIANRSAYWVPALIDTATGTPIAPFESHFYYKTGYNGIRPSEINFLPAGLRMIAGDSRNTSTTAASGTFSCHDAPSSAPTPAKHMINCPVGSELRISIQFPQCWDGVNLASPDHKSHMSYTVNQRCPATHPVALPEISFNIAYKVKEANAPLRWRLASDNYSTSLPAGLSFHADWMDGWMRDFMETWVRRCDREARDCGSGGLGDGRDLHGDNG
jgi:hypothetical protein